MVEFLSSNIEAVVGHPYTQILEVFGVCNGLVVDCNYGRGVFTITSRIPVHNHSFCLLKIDVKPILKEDLT